MKQRPNHTSFLLIFAIGLIISSIATAKSIPSQELAETWHFYGDGSRAYQNRMFYMEEAIGSKGVMAVSPESYEGDISINYELMPMNAASVCVAILAASDDGTGTSLTLPDAYDGSMGHWINSMENYFFAFHNAAHDRTPFAIRFPSKLEIGEYETNVLRSGEFQQIEIRRVGESLSLSVNGKLLFEGQDPHPLTSGHVAFRIRGIMQQPASCLIRNLTITTASEE